MIRDQMFCEIWIEIENCLSVKYILPGPEFAYIDLYLYPCQTKWGLVRGSGGDDGVVILESFITYAMAKVMFSSLSIARVCLFVCLSVC